MAAAAGGRPPSKTVFVGNLPYDVTEQQLKDLFAEVGAIKSFRLVTDRDSGKPKGYGFCEYFDGPTAESAQRNLNGHEYNGRNLRVDFAEDKEARPERRGDGPRNEGPRAPRRTAPMGIGTAHNAAQAMAAIVGAPPTATTGQDPISTALAGMSRQQLYEIMAQMKGLIQQNQGQARQILVQNPQLTKALFQAQIMLGLVKSPLADAPAAANGAPAPQMAAPLQPQQPIPMQPQVVQQQQQPLPMQGGVPQHLQPQHYAPAQQPQYQQMVPQQPQAVPQQMGMTNGVGQPAVYAQQPGYPQQQPVYQQAPQMGSQPMGGMPQQQQVDPRQAMMTQQQGQPVYAPVQHMGAMQPDGQMQQPQQPQQQQQQQQPMQQQMVMQQPQPQAAPVQLDAEAQKALLQQVMNLTPAQIDLLPEQQKAQVIALQQQMRAQGGQF